MSRLVLKARVIQIAVRFTWPHRLDQLKHLRPLAVVLDAVVARTSSSVSRWSKL